MKALSEEMYSKSAQGTYHVEKYIVRSVVYNAVADNTGLASFIYQYVSKICEFPRNSPKNRTYSSSRIVTPKESAHRQLPISH